MTTRIIFIAIAFITSLFFTSCDKEEDSTPKPTISGLEIGLGNNHIGYIGGDLHIEAEIVAEGLINKIIVEIHAEDGSNSEIEYIFDYSALTIKNTTFHEHVEIPAGFPEGEYHFHLTVTDKEGNSTIVEDDVTLEELVDTEAPEITITSAPINGQTFANGDTISIEGTITDDNALAGMLVALVYQNDNIADVDVAGTNTKVIVMLHTHDFSDPKETNFIASIKVGAANDNNMTPAPIGGDNAWKSGNYYILVKSQDAKSNGVISAHYPIVINL